LTKSDLVEEVHHALQTTYKESEGIVDIIFASMVRALRANDKVELLGLGAFIRGPGKDEWRAIPKPAYASLCRPSEFLFSNRVKKSYPWVNNGISARTETPGWSRSR
jgi:integration host factor subunit beta